MTIFKNFQLAGLDNFTKIVKPIGLVILSIIRKHTGPLSCHYVQNYKPNTSWHSVQNGKAHRSWHFVQNDKAHRFWKSVQNHKVHSYQNTGVNFTLQYALSWLVLIISYCNKHQCAISLVKLCTLSRLVLKITLIINKWFIYLS